jgi:hypothetical protein
VLVCHHDGYSMDRNNFRIYDNPLNHKLSFIPHGLDLLFDQPNLPLEPQFRGLWRGRLLRRRQDERLT